MSGGRTWGTLIGGVVGFFTGGIGFAAGAAIGGAVGGLLEPTQKTETNRIDDIKVSISKYGDGIPETWGNNIPTATCVWSTYIIELPEEPTGGKGGGVENTNYRQFIESMWCLGKTPPPGSTITIRKAWINGKLNYDASSGLSLGQALATEENPWAQIAILPGYDDQLPVAMIETYEGVGNVPAFRGRMCLFIFGLECPGGRVPQLQFEVCVNAEFASTSTTLISFAPSFLKTVSHLGDPSLVRMMYGPNWTNLYETKKVEVWDISLDGTKRISKVFDAAFNSAPAQGHSDETCFVNHATDGGGSSHTLNYYTADGGRQDIELPILAAAEQTRFVKRGQRFVAGFFNVWSGGPYVFDAMDGPARDMALGTYVACLGLTDLFIYVMHDGVVDRYDVETLAFASQVCVVPSYSVDDSSMHVVSDDEIYVADTAAGTVSRVTEGGVLQEMFTGVEPVGGVMGGTFHVAGNFLLQNNSNISAPTLRCVVRGLAIQEADVAEFIENQSIRSGLSADQVNVSDVNDSFWGLTIKGPTSARDRIAPLLTYSALGVVEEDGLLRYFRRAGKTSVATIAYEELGFAEDGSEPGDPFPLVHLNAQELPRSLTISYNDPNFDYQTSTATAMRYAVDSVLDETQTLDIAMTGDRAATIARRLLFERWLAQNTRSLAVSRKYAFLSAGDVITVLSQTGSYGDFMTGKITDTGARIEIECFPADGDLIIQTVPGPGGFPAQQIQPVASPTLLTIVDSAILRDVDNNPGVYAAMAGYGPDWNGAQLFAGDEPSSLESRGTVSLEAVQGICETILGNYTLGNVDESNLLQVNIGHGSLSSITRDALLNGVENVIAVGDAGRWEIAKFQRATDLGGGAYLLSGLLRGLQGTEWARGLHATGDKFVLLSAGGVLRPNFDSGTIGQTLTYKAVSAGRSASSAATQTSTNTGEGLKPLSPTTLRKSFGANDIVLTWGRRTRLANQWWLGTVPLGEDSERYEVDIFSDNTFTTLKRTLASTTPTITYTSADQVTDFGSNQSLVNIRIYQVSGTVGRGHALQATI